LASGVVHSELQGCFDSLGAAVGKVGLCRAVDRAYLAQLLTKLRHMPIVKIGSAEMYELAYLLLKGRYDLRMTMAGRTDRNTGIAVQKDVAVRIGYPNAAGMICHEFKVRTWIARRYIFR